MEKENFIYWKETRERIFKILGKISFSNECEKELLGIIGVINDRRHKNYLFVVDLFNDLEKQKEMVFSNCNHKMRREFKVCYHQLLVYYLKNTKNETLRNYFIEIENASMQRPSYNFDINRFEALRPLEYVIECNMRPEEEQGSLDAMELTPEECRQLLTIWLIYPKFIFYPEKIEEILVFFETAQLQVSKI